MPSKKPTKAEMKKFQKQRAEWDTAAANRIFGGTAKKSSKRKAK